MSAHVLPDSRLADPKGAVVVDWEMADGTFVRCEAEPIYCANCGKPYGFVPRDNTAFAFYLCNKCFEVYGAVAGTYAVPDDEFNRKVQEEMRARFGRDLTGGELARLAGRGELGTALELLARESPYPVPG